MSPFYDVIGTTRACLYLLAIMAEVAEACSSRSAAGPTASSPSMEEDTPRRQLGRKRVRHEQEWKQAVRKSKRNSGKEYVTKKQKTVSPTALQLVFVLLSYKEQIWGSGLVLGLVSRGAASPFFLCDLYSC